jgi:hypothetical protein
MMLPPALFDRDRLGEYRRSGNVKTAHYLFIETLIPARLFWLLALNLI